MVDVGDRVRVEILCDRDLADRLKLITESTGTTRNFLIRKAIRLYLDHRERSTANGMQAQSLR